MDTQPLEQILLKMELITREQLTEALEYQCRLPKSQHMPLADILIDMEYVSAEAIEGIERYLASPEPEVPTAERIRQTVKEVSPAASAPVQPVPTQPFAPVVQAQPAAQEEWQQMHAMEEWQQMQSLCIEESQEDAENLGKIMGDLGISDPRALQVGFTIKRKP